MNKKIEKLEKALKELQKEIKREVKKEIRGGQEKITRKYYLHKTLRSSGKEIYICNNTIYRDVYDNDIYVDGEKVRTSTLKENVRYFTEKEAKAIRNILNKGRETKLYWWGISKRNDRKAI